MISVAMCRGNLSAAKLNITKSRFRCEGAVPDMLYVYYTPDKDFTDTDQFTIQWTSQGGRPTLSACASAKRLETRARDLSWAPQPAPGGS